MHANPPFSTSARLLTEADLKRCVSLNLEALLRVEQAFAWLTERAVDMPPIQHISVSGSPTDGRGGGDVDIKSAFVPGLDAFAVKIASGFFGNSALGLPTGSGLMVVLDAKTGFCRAVLLDNGLLTDLRTALAGGVAAKYLAPEIVSTAGVLGTGRQAELQARALYLVRPFDRLLIWGRHAERAEDLKARLQTSSEGASLTEVEIRCLPSAEEVVRQSQCVVTTTPALRPLIQANWLQPGRHITAMGSDLPGKQELEADVLLKSDLCVVDRLSQCERLGELQHVEPELRQDIVYGELGDLVSGRKPGRTAPDQLTVCDLTGTGAQDTAIALFALEKAEELGLGLEVATG